jgi:putative copper resistance protein D
VNNIWLILLSWLDLTGLAIATGALVETLWLFPAAQPSRDESERSAGNGHPARRLFGLSLCLLTISTLGLLWGRTVIMSGVSWRGALPEVPLILQHTHFGEIWLWRLAILALGWVIGWRWFYTGAAKRGLLSAALLLVAVMAFTRSATGHPADQGDFTLREYSDWLHLMAAMVWTGSVIGSAIMLFPWLHDRRLPTPSTGIQSINRLSGLAGIALALLVATGILNAWWALPTVTDLWTTDYGHFLMAKIALLTVLIALGALNRYYFLPWLRALETGRENTSPPESMPPLHNRFVLSLITEALLMLLVLAVAAGLTQGVPPRP